MPYSTTTIGLDDISTSKWVDWIYEAQDSTWVIPVCQML